MATLPTKQSELIDWFESRVELWTDAPAELGLTEAKALEVEAKTGVARSAFTAAEAAETALRQANQAKAVAIANLRAAGGGAIQQIRAFAKSTDNPMVYAEAAIPAPSPPSPRPAPPMPFDLRAVLDNDGSTEVFWEGSKALGVLFTIERRTEDFNGNLSAWIQIGTSGAMSFVDDSMPLGTVCATYQIKATRGSKSSKWSEALTVRFNPTAEAPPASDTEDDNPLGLAA